MTVGYLSQSPNKRNSCSLVYFPKGWGGLIGLGLPLLHHHHHHHHHRHDHHLLPTLFPPQPPKNSGLQVPARSHLLCFYPESKASSPEGCGTQTSRHSTGEERRGEEPGPQAPERGGRREQAGRTGNITFLQTVGGARPEQGLPQRQVCGGSGSQPSGLRSIKEAWPQE